MQANGIDTLTIRKSAGISVGVGQTIVNNRKCGLAGIGSEIENITIEFILLRCGDRYVAAIYNQISSLIGKVIVRSLEAGVSGLSGDDNLVSISRSSHRGGTCHHRRGIQAHGINHISIGESGAAI